MTHEEYVQKQRQRVGNIAKEMIDGTIDYLEGAREVSILFHEVEVSQDDPDFIAFVAVVSETDNLPIGESRKYWAKESLVRLEPEIQEAIRWAKEVSLPQCKSLIQRFYA